MLFTRNKLSTLAIALSLSTTSLLATAAVFDGVKQEEAAPTSIIVKYKNQNVRSLHAQSQTALSSLGLSQQRTMTSGAFVYEINAKTAQSFNSMSAADANAELDAVIETLNQDPNVKYAVKNRSMHMMKVPNVKRYNEQWHYYEPTGGAGLPGAWDITTGKGVVVGVVDTGISTNKNISGQALPGQNFVNDSNSNDDPSDHGNGTHFHGSHVAGTIAADSHDGQTVAGIAWDAKVVPVRVLGQGGSGTFSAVIDGMRWASGLKPAADSGHTANHYPAQVINLSLGGRGPCDAAMQETVDDIRANGTIIVVAAGNSSQDAKNFVPANCDGVVTVGATNRMGWKAFYSNYGDTVDIAAPGGETMFGQQNGVLSTTGPGKFEFLQGTSMASPHIAGITALMLSVNPKLDTAGVIKIMQETARGTVSNMNVGIVDAEKAVKAAQALVEEVA